MRTFIEHSRNAPIHVTVLITNALNDLSEDAQPESPCLELLASQCHRWKTAIFHSKISTFTGLPWDLAAMRPAGLNLNACTFRGPVSVMSYPTKPIRFNRLRALVIENNNYQPPNLQFRQAFETPFRWMAAPNLEMLIVKGHPILPGASPIVRDLLLTTFPSSSMLLSLRFDVRGLTEDDFKTLLSATLFLKHLDICDTPSHHFSHLLHGNIIAPGDPHQPLF
jgi:hypothetical protein